MIQNVILLLSLASVVSCKTVRTDVSASKSMDGAAPIFDTKNVNPKEMTIEGPFKDLIYIRRMGEFDEDGLEWTDSYQKVKVTYESKVLNGTVRQRGGISYCNSFPQLKLKLGKDLTIEGQKEFKIITHGFHGLDP